MVSAGVRLPGASRKQGKGGTTVTEKELRKLNRAELLEMLIAQSKKLSRVEDELSAAQKELERRKIAITTSGSLAEAALKLNGIFEAADQAAAQYLDSLREQESNAAHYCRGRGQGSRDHQCRRGAAAGHSRRCGQGSQAAH